MRLPQRLVLRDMLGTSLLHRAVKVFLTYGNAAEDDASLTADDRAIARFQKQRLKEFAGNFWCSMHMQCS